MRWILSDILSLPQYLMFLDEQSSDILAQLHCPHCGYSALWIHGCYYRKADRSHDGALNPVRIMRYICTGCWRTCSALPECLPPRRWYLWEVLQVALLIFLSSGSLRAAASVVTASRRTVGRWMARLREMYRIHRDTLCNYLVDLGRSVNFEDFWPACLQHFSLAKSMRLCHAAGVPVP